jgi:ureidoglycolate hydrolase
MADITSVPVPVRDIPLIALTPETFAPFGAVIAPLTESERETWPAPPLDLSAGTPRFYAMRLGARPLEVRRITRHRRVTQSLASVDGSDWFMLVAPPVGLDVPAAEPALEDIRGFLIPGGVAIMMYRGTWHAGPLFVGPEASFFNLELADTNVTDHQSCDLVARYGIALRPVPA